MRMSKCNFKLAIIAAVLGAFVASTTRAQEADTPAEMQCLRYLQSQERGHRIPQGLLTAISLAETGRPTGPDGALMPWPWTINVGGRGQYFETKEDAVAETRRLLDEGQRSIDVGCMQVNLRYHPNAFQNMEEAFDPAANVAYGAKFLTSLHQLQGSWSKAVERYHSSDDGRREQYRERVIALWNTEARNIVMNAVLAENTDTPYHRAIRDFAAGRFSESLDKYQGIVDLNPNDRIGLLGVAMSYEELGRDTEAMQAYARYLIMEPGNHSVLARVLQKITAKAPAEARADLEALVKAGANQSDLYATLSELAAGLDENDAALGYALDAVQRAPTVAAYALNAGVLADKLNRHETAVHYYDQFLDLFARQRILADASIDDVRNRVTYLRSRL